MSTFFSTRAGRCIRLIMTVEHLHDSSARIILIKPMRAHADWRDTPR